MFLQNARALAFSLAIAVRWGSNIVLLYAFQYMYDAMKHYVFLVFLSVMAAAFVFLLLYLPETKDHPRMEIHDMVSHGFDHIVLHVEAINLENAPYRLHLRRWTHRVHEAAVADTNKLGILLVNCHLT